MMHEAMELTGVPMVIIKAHEGIKEKLISRDTSLTIKKFRNNTIRTQSRQ